MKKIITGFVALVAIIILSNCTSQTNVPENTKREWMLVEFQDFTKEMMMNNKANLNLTPQNEKGKFSANMGCNSMLGSATFSSNGMVKFSDIGSTMMYCDKAMDLEAAFIKDLPTITNYKVEGHYLTLSNGTGKKMKFVAADWD